MDKNVGAFIFAKGVQEIRKIGLVLGAQADTFWVYLVLETLLFYLATGV